MYVDNRSRRGSYRPYRPMPNKQPSQARKILGSKVLWTLLILVSLVAGGGWLIVGRGHDKTADTTASSSSKKAASSQPATPAAFNKKQFSLSQANSLWVVVNKKHVLNPAQYTPNNLVIPTIPQRSNITGDERYVSNTMAPALQTMIADASNQGVHLNLQSGYRSYSFQVTLFNSYVKQEGLAAANTQSAHAGYSEHQTGLAADLGGTTTPACNVAQCFASTPEGIWLAGNAFRYGFIIRYPSDKQTVTGYEYEPWHVRYVGVALSTEMHNQGIETLEEFFDLGAAPDY